MRQAFKNIISLSVVLISGIGTITAFADPFAGAIAAGMDAMGVSIGVTGNAQAFSDLVSGPTSNDPLADWSDPLGDYRIYYEKDAKSKTEGGVTTNYDLIWFSPDYAAKIQAEGIAFINQYGIQDESSGQLASGTGTVYGFPVYNVGGYLMTQSSAVPATNGSYFVPAATVTVSKADTNYLRLDFACADGATEYTTGNYKGGFPYYYRVRIYQNPISIKLEEKTNVSSTWNSKHTYPSSAYDNTPFTFDYVAGTIDATTTNKGLQLYIPSGYLQDKMDGYRDYANQADRQDMLDFVNAITDGAGHNEIDEPEWKDLPDPPVPPVPVPDTPLGEVPFDDWVDLWGQGIQQELENIGNNQSIDHGIGEDQLEELENIDTNLDDLNQTAESIDTNVAQSTGLLGDIKNGIQSLGQTISGTISNTLSNILDGVEEIAENVVLATETLIAGILNQIPVVFGVILTPIKQASSIWHYVVEWVGSIAGPFSWIRTMVGGTSYYILLPVYASLAGSVVLAFYKRFGK